MMPASVAILHAGGYAGRELIRLLLRHPLARITAITSRTFAGQPVEAAHPSLRGETDILFCDPEALDISTVDALLITAEHGKSAPLVRDILAEGYNGAIVDLSADFRFSEAETYKKWFGQSHPAPDLLGDFCYGMVDVHAPYAKKTKWIANPGCFATGITLALWPLAKHLHPLHASVTALTGASGSGTRPKITTHFPTRDGNVRAYKTLTHQHLPEIQKTLGPHADIAFVPVSGPWTHGIWGTAHVVLSADINPSDISHFYQQAYGAAACVRLWPNTLPELRFAVGTPFCDLGWVVQGRTLIVGFALDNLLKGAASQAIENLNQVMEWPATTGLLPQTQLP